MFKACRHFIADNKEASEGMGPGETLHVGVNVQSFRRFASAHLVWKVGTEDWHRSLLFKLSRDDVFKPSRIVPLITEELRKTRPVLFS